MSELKRYQGWQRGCTSGMEEAPNGPYVELADVVTMLTERIDRHGGESTMYHVEGDEEREGIEATKEAVLKEFLNDLLTE